MHRKCIIFRWKLITDGRITYHGLNIKPKTSENDRYTYGSQFWP